MLSTSFIGVLTGPRAFPDTPRPTGCSPGNTGRSDFLFDLVDPMRSTVDDIVAGIIEKWSAGFERLDAVALASLYSNGAFFFGSNPSLYRGRDGVAAYFNALPRWRSQAVQFTDVVTELVSPDLINLAATASFVLDEGATTLSVKITWVIAREDGDWKIVSHHVSSKVPLL
jgi:uncharacterized protein (TIGR02246 family)